MTTNPPRGDAPELARAAESISAMVHEWYTAPIVTGSERPHIPAKLIKQRLARFRADTPARAGMVKPLVWSSDLQGRWIGEPPVKLGTLAFWVFQTSAGFEQYTKEGKKSHTTLEAAKAAAQADYERRILAALLPTEAEPPEVQITKLGRSITMDEIEKWDSGCNPTPPSAPTDMAMVAHIKKMQSYVREYLEPGPYISKHGNGDTFNEPHPHQDEGHAYFMRQQMREAVLNDLIHMLDGPEERAALASRAAPPEAQVTVADCITVVERMTPMRFNLGGDKFVRRDDVIAALRALAGGEV